MPGAIEVGTVEVANVASVIVMVAIGPVAFSGFSEGAKTPVSIGDEIALFITHFHHTAQAVFVEVA